MRWLTLLAPLVVAACVQTRPPVKPPTPPDEGERISAEEAAWVDETGAVRMFPEEGSRPIMHSADLRRVVLKSYGDRTVLRMYGPTGAPRWVRWYRVGWETWYVWNNAGLVREILVVQEPA